MKKLPIDIIYMKIIPYTYNLQNKKLIDDIKNYKESKTKLLNLYYKFWIIEIQELEPEDKRWLLTDLIFYINDYNLNLSVMNLRTIDNVNIYVFELENKEIEPLINILWGSLFPKDRNYFVDLSYLNYYERHYIYGRYNILK